MKQFDPAGFFAATRVFNRADYAAAAGIRPDDPELMATLARHVGAGDIKHVVQDVFASVPDFSTPDSWLADGFLVASRLRPDCVLAYHSALDLHGCAYTSGCLVQAFSAEEPGELAADGVFFHFMTPPRGIVLGDGPPADGIESVDWKGAEIRMTTIERTVVDIFARLDLCDEGRDDLLDLVDELDPAAVVQHARALDDAAVAGALGFWLERRRDLLGVDDSQLRELRALAPRCPRYALEAGPTDGLLVEDWNVILPSDVVAPAFQGMRA